MENKSIVLSKGQEIVMRKFIEFINNDSSKIFVLRGYAGTGKTTMVKEMIKMLQKRNEEYHLLASTGRAAKIMSNVTGENASTVHSMIYRYSGFTQDLEHVVKDREAKGGVDETGQLLLNFGLSSVGNVNITQYYIIDEASMISDKEDKKREQAIFGSGRLLNDLMQYDSKGKFIFVGDICQLPPISQTVSPALSVDYLRRMFSVQAEDAELTEIMRQSKDNGIVSASHKLRELYKTPQPWKWAKFPLRNRQNIHLVGNQTELLQRYIQDIKTHGLNYSTLLCYTNRQCNMITGFVRPALGILSPELSKGDLLLVTQNNIVSGLMNGDLVVVKDILAKERRAGLTFLKVSVEELFTKRTYSQLLIADIIYSNQINLSSIQQKELFIDFYLRMKDMGIEQKTAMFEKHMMTDPYLNALRAVYGYALTCHKAQGGEWENVYIDIPRNFAIGPKPYVYQWLYTAMTRARKELYLADDFYIM